MAPRTIIIDCDPGKDDMVALLLACAAPAELELALVTTVGGNVPLAKTTRNAGAILTLAGRGDIPVHAGCAGPLVGPLVTAEHVHGDDGLGALVLPAADNPPAAAHAADAIIDAVLGRPPGTVTLCPIGPLTNVALALHKEPRLAGHLREIVLMGGARDLGNATPAAEFNIYVDPPTAAAVFGAGVPLTMFGLEATRPIEVTPERWHRLAAIDTRAARACTTLLGGSHVEDGAPAARGPILHDACVIAWLLQPELFAGRLCRVDVETDGRLCRGRTVVDWHARLPDPPNALVMAEADAPGFFALLSERLGMLP